MSKRGVVRGALALLAGLAVAAGGAGSARAGLLAGASSGENPRLTISHEAAGWSGGLETVRDRAAPLASLGVFQADTSRPVESAWAGQELSGGSRPGLAHPASAVSLDLPALAAEPSKAAALESAGALPDSTTGRPTDDFSYLGLGPKAFAIMRSGRPSGGLEQWSHASETSLSYVQPRRHLEFVARFFGENKEERGDSLSKAPIGSQEQLVDNLHVDVDSADLSLRSQEYGRIAKAEHKEPPSGRMLAIGLDLGLLPAVVGNLGLNSELIIGRSSNPGFYLGLATNVEFPAERGSSQGEPGQAVRTPYDIGGGGGFGGGGLSVSSGGGGGGGSPPGGGGGTSGGGGTPPYIPLTPTPEPGTLVLVAFGSAWLVGRRRAGK